MKTIKFVPDHVSACNTVIQITMTPDELSRQITEAVRVALSQVESKPDDTLLTRKQAAKYLNISLPTLNKWEKGGEIEAVRKGSRVYFLKRTLLTKAA